MATLIKLKRSGVTGSVPEPSDLQSGELAVNTSDEKLYTLNSGGGVIELFSGLTGTTGPTGPVGSRGATGPVGAYVTSFNGLTGVVDVTGSKLHVGGLSADNGATFGDNIALQYNDYISNPSAYTVRMMPEGTSATDYGLEFEFSDWGYGPVITSRKASDLSNAGIIRFDSNVSINNNEDLIFGNNAHSRMRWTTEGNNTLQVGVKSSDTNDSCSGAFALIHSSHLGQAYRSPGVTHDNPNLYVYAESTDATNYIRFEHDGTDAKIVTGAGDISLHPASGVVAVTGDINISGGATFGGNILLPEDGKIGVVGDSDELTLNFGGGVLDMNVSYIDVKQYLRHKGDPNTWINYQADQITLRAGGTDYIDITSSGTNFADTDVVRPKLKDYSETALATSSKSASFNVDFESGNVQSFTFADDLTVSFTNPPASGAAGTVTLIITNGGANTTTWNAAVKWPGDNAPALTSSGVDIVSFMTIDAGTTIYGFVGGINFS